MADEGKTFTKDQLDEAIAAAVGKVQESVDRLEAKNKELIGDLRTARKAGEIKPEDLEAAEERADKAEKALADATKQIGTLTKERDTAVKSLETEQGAARTYATDAEIAGAIAAGNVVPALVPALTAMVRGQSKAELVEGKYQVLIGDKPAKDYITTFLGSEEGKAFKAAPANGGGGAQGSSGTPAGGKTVTREAFEAMDQGGRIAHVKDGGTVVDA